MAGVFDSTVTRAPLSRTDLLATTAAIVSSQLSDAAGEDGYNILPAFLETSPQRPVRGPLVMHNVEGAFAIRQGPWKYVATGAARGANPKDSLAK